jgi:hypothetical protein
MGDEAGTTLARAFVERSKKSLMATKEPMDALQFALLRLRTDSTPGVRADAVRLLHKGIKTERDKEDAVQGLIQALGDEDVQVRTAAADALHQLAPSTVVARKEALVRAAGRYSSETIAPVILASGVLAGMVCAWLTPLPGWAGFLAGSCAVALLCAAGLAAGIRV